MQAAVSAASLVVEIVAGRMLAPYVGMSLYTWTSVIAVVLAGFSAGHWLGGRLADAPTPRALAWMGWSMVGAALTTAGATLLLRWSAGPVMEAFEEPVAVIVALTVLAFFLPSFFAGVPAPVLAKIAATADPSRSGRALGAIFAAGAIGAIAGTLAAGFLFISWLGSAATLTVVTIVYVVLAALSFRVAGWPERGIALALMVGAALLPLGVAARSLALPDPCTRESDYFCIRVVDISADPEKPVRLMVLDHLAHGISARDVPEVMFYEPGAMLYTLSRARMERTDFRVFLIGGGSYSLPRAWGQLEPRPEITVAEIDPLVTEVAASDFWFDRDRATVLNQDARHALAADERKYDLIVGDAFTDIAVPAHLITEEFFRLVRSRLEEDGVYLMNVIDHVDQLHALSSILRTLKGVFPVVEVWVDAKEPAPGERMIFAVLAGATPTTESGFSTLAPGPFRFARLSQAWQERVMKTKTAIRLKDDYAPIDRLMRWTD